MNHILQSMVVALGYGFFLTATGLAVTDAMFWCGIILWFLGQHFARVEGKAEGVLTTHLLIRARAKQLMEQLGQGNPEFDKLNKLVDEYEKTKDEHDKE